MLNVLGIVVSVIAFLCSARLVYVNLVKEDRVGSVDFDRFARVRLSPLRRVLKVLEINLEPLFFIAGIVLTGTAVSLAFSTVFPEHPGLSALAGIKPSRVPPAWAVPTSPRTKGAVGRGGPF